MDRDAPWHNRFAQCERLHAILDRHVRQDDVALTDAQFIHALMVRFDRHMQAHIVDVNE